MHSLHLRTSVAGTSYNGEQNSLVSPLSFLSLSLPLNSILDLIHDNARARAPTSHAVRQDLG